MTGSFGRREFFTLLGGAATWPMAARAQQPAMPVIGYLSTTSSAGYVAAFRRGLKEIGYVEDQNVAIEYRFAEGQYDRLPALTIDLVSRRVNAIFAFGNPAARAAKPASIATPIVFAIGLDPVQLGLVAGLNRPGGNMTGVSFVATVVVAKMLEVLHEAIPKATVVAVLVNPANPNSENNTREAQEAVRILGLDLHVLHASTQREIDQAIATLVERRAGALLITGDAFFTDQFDHLVALLARHSIPAISSNRDFADAGGLMSYGTSITDAHRISGGYVGRILKGEKAADLPVQQSTRVELILNLKTAKSLGITFPLTLLGRADEVIE